MRYKEFKEVVEKKEFKAFGDDVYIGKVSDFLYLKDIGMFRSFNGENLPKDCMILMDFNKDTVHVVDDAFSAASHLLFYLDARIDIFLDGKKVDCATDNWEAEIKGKNLVEKNPGSMVSAAFCFEERYVGYEDIGYMGDIKDVDIEELYNDIQKLGVADLGKGNILMTSDFIRETGCEVEDGVYLLSYESEEMVSVSSFEDIAKWV